MSHGNAPLTPEGRRRLCLRVDEDRAICHVATEAGVHRATLTKWYRRWLAEGEVGLQDRSSQPHRSPNQTPPHVEELVCRVRRERRIGPVQVSGILAQEHQLRVPASTVHRILVRHGLSRLRDMDTTGEDLREPVRRYEHAHPGDLIHLDVKKLGRIPPGGGWRASGRGSTRHRSSETARHAAARARRTQPPQPAQKTTGRIGYVYLHTAIDDHSRLAYTEELYDETGATVAEFWARAVVFFAAHHINHIERVLTDNGACYRSHAFAGALAASGTRHKRTRPYRPQTNGKVERYHRTLANEWARSRDWHSNNERAAALQGFLDHYNYRRPHTALGHKPPISRTPAR